MLIAHATDLTGDDEGALVHATALAAAGGARLVTVHGNPGLATAAQLPDAAALAARWGRTVAHQRLCHECCDDVEDTVLDALHRLRPDLVVVGTHGRHGFAALLRGSVSEAIARNLDVPALVVPDASRGFVDPATGDIDLGCILIPAGDRSDAERGIDAARSFVALAGARGAELEIVHVGDDDPALGFAGVTVTRAHGKLEHAISEAAQARRACLIVMATRGHDGVGDVLLGSHTERVIREVACPVLSVPFTAAHPRSADLQG
jgi:nucleotide-binding universal stress UspA family protein